MEERSQFESPKRNRNTTVQFGIRRRITTSSFTTQTEKRKEILGKKKSKRTQTFSSDISASDVSSVSLDSPSYESAPEESDSQEDQEEDSIPEESDSESEPEQATGTRH